MADVVLAALVLVPAILTFFLKSNSALAFLALCTGFVVISFAGTDLKNLTGQLNFSINSSILNLILLALPFLLTLLIARKAFSGGVGQVLYLAIALCAGGLLALVAIPLLNESARTNLAGSKLWMDLQNIQSEVVGVGVFLSLIMVWAKAAKKASIKDKKKK